MSLGRPGPTAALTPVSSRAAMKPQARPAAHSSVSTKRITPAMVSPMSMSRMALVMAIPGIKSMTSPMNTLSTRRSGSAHETAQMMRPTASEHTRLKMMRLGATLPQRRCMKATSRANTPATRASSHPPPKNTAKPAAANTLPA